MKKLSSLLLASAVAAALSGCAATSEQTPPDTSHTPPASQPQKVVTPVADVNPAAAGQITLKQIMSDPQWLGRQPEHALSLIHI